MINYYEAAFDPGFDEGGGLDEPDTIRKSNRRAAKATGRPWPRRTPTTKATACRSARHSGRSLRKSDVKFSDCSGARTCADLSRGLEAETTNNVEIADAAYWRKGCSSLGRLRYAVLLRVGSKSDSRQHCLVDLKEAVKPGAPHALEGMPRDFAKRVAAGASHLSPYLGARMRAVELLGKPLFARVVSAGFEN